MKIKQSVFALALLPMLAFKCLAQGTTQFDFGGIDATIPDNDASGYQDSRNLSGLAGIISDVTVTLNISGGFNGDLYAWLSHGSGLAILLNRVGISSSNSVGYANTGFGTNAQQARFTLDDHAAQDVHFYQAGAYALNSNGQLTGTWQPDGRMIDPSSAPAQFDGAPRPNMLSGLDGMVANGGWTLFIADLSPGGVSTLNGWGLNITTVPEPATATLLSLGLAMGLWKTSSRRCRH